MINYFIDDGVDHQLFATRCSFDVFRHGENMLVPSLPMTT